MHNKTTKLRFYTEAFLFTPRETGEAVSNNFFAVAKNFSRPCLGNDHYCGRLRAYGFRISCPRLTKSADKGVGDYIARYFSRFVNKK